MASLDEAVNMLENQDWQAAHAILQSDSSRLACWAHGIVHLMEGDRSNAAYWYGRADRELSDSSDIERELSKLKAEIACS